MGFLSILKKMKQKEKEMRILMLYPFQKDILGNINFTESYDDLI